LPVTVNASARTEMEADSEAGSSVHFSLDVNERLVTNYDDASKRPMAPAPVEAAGEAAGSLVVTPSLGCKMVQVPRGSVSRRGMARAYGSLMNCLGAQSICLGPVMRCAAKTGRSQNEHWYRLQDYTLFNQCTACTRKFQSLRWICSRTNMPARKARPEIW
jgi:hypothetical protein